MNALSNKQVATTKPKQIVLYGSLQVLDAELNEKIERNGFQNLHFNICAPAYVWLMGARMCHVHM